MQIKSDMSRKDMQTELYERGASTSLIKMPAVIIAIRNAVRYADRGEETFNIYKYPISLGGNDEIMIKTDILNLIAKIKSLPNGEARYESKFQEAGETRASAISIDSFGMEYRRELYRLVGEDKNQKSLISTIERDQNNGLIRYEEISDSNFQGPIEYKYKENGMPTLSDIETWAGQIGEELPLSGILEENMGDMLTNYPETKGWYEARGMFPTNAYQRNKKLKDCIQARIVRLRSELEPNKELPFGVPVSMMTNKEVQIKRQIIKEEIKEKQALLEKDFIKLPESITFGEVSKTTRLKNLYDRIKAGITFNEETLKDFQELQEELGEFSSNGKYFSDTDDHENR